VYPRGVSAAGPGDNETSEERWRRGRRVDSEHKGKDLLGKRYGRDHLTNEETEALDPRVVTEEGEIVSPEELRGRIFRIVDRDEPSGYMVRNMETTGEGTTLCHLQASSSWAQQAAWARG
jgi:hypothetical protein